MVWDFLKYCYMRFRPSPFVWKCVCYLLEAESQANIIWGRGVEKAPQTQIQSIVAQILCWFSAIVLSMKCLFPEVPFRLILLPAWCVSAFIHIFSILMNFEGCRAEAGIPNPCNLCNIGMVCMELRIHSCFSPRVPELYSRDGECESKACLAWVERDPAGSCCTLSPGLLQAELTHTVPHHSQGTHPQQGQLSHGQTPWNCYLPSLNLYK